MTPQDRTEELVDRIMEIAHSRSAPDIWTLVGHKWPDIDAWMCLWLAKRFIPEAANARIAFVNAGERLLWSDNDRAVLHFDTGGGQYDQHGKSAGRTSSAMLLAKNLGIQDDPGLKALLELTIMVDNVEELSPTNLHYIIEGLPRVYQNARRQPDWEWVQGTVFQMFEIIYGQETGRQRSRDTLGALGSFYELSNGIRVAEILENPSLREAAFERRADVVVWTDRKKGGFYVGVQVNRRSRVTLSEVVAELRKAEAEVRGINVEGQRLDYEERREPVPNWFLHDSLNLILCGSRTWELAEDEFTKLTRQQVCEAVRRALERIPEQVVRGRR